MSEEINWKSWTLYRVFWEQEKISICFMGTRIIFIINGNSLRQFLKKQLRHKDEHFDHSPSPKVLNRVNGGVGRKVSFRLASVV